MAVIVVEPIPTIVIVLPAAVATAVFELAYVKAPSLLDVGDTGTKGASPKDLMGNENAERVGAAWLTVSVAVIVPDEWVAEAACVAVMVELPAPTMVTVFPATVATAVFELVYVNVPALLDVGSVSVKAASPTVFAETEKPVMVGFTLVTVKVAEMLAAVKLNVLACEAVIVEVPEPTSDYITSNGCDIGVRTGVCKCTVAVGCRGRNSESRVGGCFGGDRKS